MAQTTGKTKAKLKLLKLPNSSAKTIATVPKKTKVIIINSVDNYYYVKVTIKKKDYEGYLLSSKVKADSSNVEKVSKYDVESVSNILGGTTSDASNYSASDTPTIGQKLLVHNLTGIHGIPYQFMNSVDRKLDGTVFGQRYASRIIAKMPLLLVTPGKVEFMKQFKTAEKKNILTKIISDDERNQVSDLINSSGRYYTFAFDYSSYYQYVNNMLRTGSIFLGIDDVKVNIGGNKDKLGYFNWGKAVNSQFQSLVSSKEFVGFYVDSASSVNEDFSNSTTESQLSSKVNELSATARELNFLLGYGSGNTLDLMDTNALETTMETIDNISEKYLKGNQLFKDIANNFATIASGGKLLFPEIWSESTYSKSYDIKLKLRTPDCDVLSWYMNIYVPLCHLLCLTLPRQASANGYKSPFLIRASYRGLFNCDMGIVESLSVTKGAEAAWTLDGLPTEVDVDLRIKDLYSALMMTSSADSVGWFMNNTSLMDYIANTCGININQPELQRTVSVWLMLRSNKFTDIPSNIWTKVQNETSNLVMDIYNKATSILK